MDIAEALDIIFMGVHAKAVAEDKSRLLLDLDMVNEGRYGGHGIHLFGVVGLITQDLDDLDRVAAGGFECNLAPDAGGEGE
jgi:hypothetical protein